MNHENPNPNPNPDDAALGALLRQSRLEPPLPLRFQEEVWRRVAAGDAPKSAGVLTWADAWIARLLRPRLAFAAVAALVIAGAFWGARVGSDVARRDAQARYLAAVAPGTLR